MRYLGNKKSILKDIEKLLLEKGLLDKNLIFFDAFCGTGSVADYFKNNYSIVINDNLHWAVTYSQGRIRSNHCTFDKLGFDPFVYLNNNNEVKHEFIYKNYSQGGSARMYFTADNAERIDYFRYKIEEWKDEGFLNQDEYAYLLSSLIESVSLVSNTAGVYGAFLKKWDSRALKPIIFRKVESFPYDGNELETYNDKIESIIKNVNCDILYLDPPYTQNQYGTQYHLLETLILDDNPSISTVTGSRKTAPMRSDWSKDVKCHILFNQVIEETKAKYILFSYNNDGFMSKEFIESTLKRFGKEETYIFKKIQYKKYQNWKSCKEDAHFEYLFFIEKKDSENVIYESPLNYTGSKSKIVLNIKNNIPMNKATFFDLFGGGFNVGINMSSSKSIYVDINHFVKEIIESFYKYDTYTYISFVKKTIKKFNLTKANAESYLAIREYYNNLPLAKRDPRILFTMIMYGFQQQIRFNGNHNFNNPVGMRWFNDKILEKLISFSRHLKNSDSKFISASYLDIEDDIDENSFVYMDPPYKLTTGSYNDGKRGFKGWNEILEDELFSFSDRLTRKNIPFMLSYVIQHKGKVNHNLLRWIEKNSYMIIELGDVLGISGTKRKEVLIVNYER
jgi:adenine-specific DNA-methyltransferase